MTDRCPRRRLLAATGTALAATVAGCGYQPAGGDLDWHESVSGSGGFTRSSDELWRTDGDRLFRIVNWSGRTFDHDASRFVDVEETRIAAYGPDGSLLWSDSTDEQYVGSPVVADGRVYLALADGRLQALERASDDADAESPGRRSVADATVRWTAEIELGTERERDGPTSTPFPRLYASSALVVAADEPGLVAFDADGGDERFALEPEPAAFDGRSVVDVATADERLWAVASDDRGDTLYGLSDDGDVSATISLPASPDWLETVGPRLLLGVDGAVWVVDPDGERRFEIELEGGSDGRTAVVERRNRLYRYANGTLEAIDASEGERLWSREGYSFREGPVADADGVYGRGSGPETDGCGFVALEPDGDRWWAVPPFPDLGCSGDCYLVGDRLIVVLNDDLYGFRTAPGDRVSVIGD